MKKLRLKKNVMNLIMGPVRCSVWDSVSGSVMSSVNRSVRSSVYVLAWDLDWVSVNDDFQKNFKRKKKNEKV